MRRTTKLSLCAVLVLVMLILGSMPAQAGGKKVMYTASMASLGKPTQFGQPSGLGLVMFDDGSMKGMVAISTDSPSTGQIILHYEPVSWVEIIPGVLIQITMELRWIKGFYPYPTTLVSVAPVTGEPIFIDNDGDGDADVMMRVSQVS